jgi:hypothetical protein
MALGALIYAANDISFAGNEALLPALPPGVDGEARLAIIVTELDAAAELVPESGDTAGLVIPIVEAGAAPYEAGIWRRVSLPTVLYSTSASAASVRCYVWVT